MDEKQRSFLNLFGPAQPRLSNYVRAMTSDGDEAKDVMSETILAAYEQFDHLHKPEAFLFYLFSIARRQTKRMHWRKRLFRAPSESDTEIADASMIPAETSTDIALLYAALGQLPHVQREAITMHSIAGLSIDEVGKLQGASSNTVKARVKRGRARLAVLLGASDNTTVGLSDTSLSAPAYLGDVEGDGLQ